MPPVMTLSDHEQLRAEIALWPDEGERLLALGLLDQLARTSDRLALASGALADIASSGDMTLKVVRSKAARIYRTVMMSDSDLNAALQ